MSTGYRQTLRYECASDIAFYMCAYIYNITSTNTGLQTDLHTQTSAPAYTDTQTERQTFQTSRSTQKDLHIPTRVHAHVDVHTERDTARHQNNKTHVKIPEPGGAKGV